MTARVAFLGTPEAAVPTLLALHDHFEVGVILTQPDRPQGRSKRKVPSPVKKAATELGLAVSQPTSRAALETALNDSAPLDLGVVVAYGRILSEAVLDIPEHGFLNVHFSLLPRWRGAAPVARALMEGDVMTGVTIIQLDPGLDTGPVLTAQAVDIGPTEDAGTLTGRLAQLGSRLLTGAVPPYLGGSITPIAQTDEGATYADKLSPADRPIDPSLAARRIIHQVRALAPSPAATLDIDGERHKVFSARDTEGQVDQGRWSDQGGRLLVGVGDGVIELEELQPPGRNRQTGEAWLRGRRATSGNVR